VDQPFGNDTFDLPHVEETPLYAQRALSRVSSKTAVELLRVQASRMLNQVDVSHTQLLSPVSQVCVLVENTDVNLDMRGSMHHGPIILPPLPLLIFFLNSPVRFMSICV
jgi:hypothetical protein